MTRYFFNVDRYTFKPTHIYKGLNTKFINFISNIMFLTSVTSDV